MCIGEDVQAYNLLFLAILVQRGYMPAPVITIHVLLTIEFGLNILQESYHVNDVFICAKNRLQRYCLQSYLNVFLKAS